MITVLLVEDEPLVRKGLRMLLTREPDMTIVGEVSSASEGLALIQLLRPNVVLMDTTMQDMDGIAAMVALPGSALVLLSLYDNTPMRARAQAAGAVAFVGKQEGVKVLLVAIRQAAIQAYKRSQERSR